MNKEQTVEPSTNAFGKLVKSFRELRQWSQGELAEVWGYTREYVSLIERGERKLEKYEQIYSLADILGIPSERLEAVGKGIPQRRMLVEQATGSDEILLRVLLEPMLVNTKLSWIAWLSDSQNVPLAEHLSSVSMQLEDACLKYRGSLRRPAQKILAYTHEVQGMMAFDQLRYTEANGHFQDMFDLGEALGDANLMVLAQIQRADILQERERCETAVRMLNALYTVVEQAEDFVKGMYHQVLARAHAEYGYEGKFLENSAIAENIVRNRKESIDTLYHQFHLREVLQERAEGFTVLGKPAKALALLAQTEKMQPLRSMRARGTFLLMKAQASICSGDMDMGIDLALQAIKLARSSGSLRHLNRIQRMYDRLVTTDLGKHARMRELKEALMGK